LPRRLKQGTTNSLFDEAGDRHFAAIFAGICHPRMQNPRKTSKKRRSTHKNLRKLWKSAVFLLTLPTQKLHCFER